MHSDELDWKERFRWKLEEKFQMKCHRVIVIGASMQSVLRLDEKWINFLRHDTRATFLTENVRWRRRQLFFPSFSASCVLIKSRIIRSRKLYDIPELSLTRRCIKSGFTCVLRLCVKCLLQAKNHDKTTLMVETFLLSLCSSVELKWNQKRRVQKVPTLLRSPKYPRDCKSFQIRAKKARKHKWMWLSVGWLLH